MRRSYLILGLISLFLLMSANVFAQDDAPNWCDAPDGPWYYGDGLSRCNTQPTLADNLNMWVAGYYGALYDAGEITLDELFAIDPAIAGNIIAVRLPELLISPASSGSGSSFDGCYIRTSPTPYGSTSISVAPNGEVSILVYDENDTTCSTLVGTTGGFFFAVDATVANTICGNGTPYIAVNFNDDTTPNFPTNIYRCRIPAGIP